MSGRGPARRGLGRLEVLVAAVLATLGVPVSGAADDRAEDRLDVSLKLLYRAQKAFDGHDLRQGKIEAPDRERALVALERVRGGRARGRTAAGAGVVCSARLPLLVKSVGERSGLEAAGFEIEAQLGHLYTGTLDPERLAELTEVEGVRFVQTSRTLRASGIGAAGQGPLLSPDPAAVAPSVFAAERRTGPHVLSGAGALVAFIDTGVDVQHQDFRKADGTTRIKSLLDLSDPGDVDGDGDLDGGGPYGGTLYTEAQINAGLSGGAMAERDSTGHGTHGLSVAAGDDPGFPGYSPAADLLVVKATREDGSLGFLSNDVVNALAFVDQKAQELGLPYVVNLSLGTLVSAHDGRSLEEQAIDALVGPGKAGKVAVVAAGNSSENRSGRFHHFSGTSYPGLSWTHTLTLPPYTANPGQGNDRVLLDFWHEGADRHTIAVTPPGGSAITVPFGQYADVETAQGNVFIANLGGPSPENGDVEAVVLLDDWAGIPPAPGNWTITVTGEQVGDTGVYHAWLADDSLLGTAEPHFSANADNRSLVGKPGSAFGAITVGSFARHDPTTRFRTSWTDVNAIGRTDTTAILEDISDFSSPGPTRDGRVKPEVTAPGERVLGAVAADALPCSVSTSIYLFHPFAECDGLLTDQSSNHAFGLLQGTSFSAPVVTGLAARILSTNPTLDAIQVRNILINTASAAVPVGTVPNDAWGYGKVDLGVGDVTLPGNVRITTDSLSAGVRTKVYAHVLTAAGGTLPYSWSLQSGTLPPGLTLDAGGLLTGTPTTAGTYNVTVQVTDASVPTQADSRSYSITIATAAALQVVTSGLPVGRIDLAYAEALQGEGGTLPHTWAIVGGALPPGLSLLANGTIQGVPTELGRRDFTVQLTDATPVSVVRALSIKVVGQGAEDWTPLGKTRPTVNQIAVDPNDPQHLIASTRNIDAIFESTNGGDSWRPMSINKGLSSSAFHLAFGPVSSTPWAVTDFVPGIGSPTARHLYRFEGVSDQWIRTIPLTSGQFETYSQIAFDAAENVFVIASEAGGLGGHTEFLVRSPDRGVTWSTLGHLAPVFHAIPAASAFLSISRPKPSSLYALRYWGPGAGGSTTETAIDGGSSWNDIENGSGLASNGRDIQVSQADPLALDVVKAGADEGGPLVHRSLDAGRNWEKRYAATEGALCCMRRADTVPALLLLGTDRGLYKSTDTGSTWSLLPMGSVNGPVGAMAIDPTDADVFYVATDEGLYKSTDGGGSWIRKSSGLMRRTLGAIAVSGAEPATVAISAAEGPYVSRSSGDSWTLSTGGIPTPSPSKLAISAADPTLMLVGSEDGVYRSDNRGASWSLWTDPTSGGGDRVLALDADPFDATTVLTGLSGTKGVYRSVNRGQTWAGASAGLPFTEPTDLAFARDLAGRVYVSMTTKGIYRSDDKGTTWSPFGLNSETVKAVAPAPSDSRYVYAATSATVHFLDPGVGSWTSATTGPASPIITIAVDATQPLIAYAGADHPGSGGATGGVYKTTDGGRNWARLTGVLDQFDVVSLATHPTASGTLYAATLNGGVYRSTDAGATWTELPNYGTVADLTNVTVKHPSEVLLYAGTEGYGIQVSSDGGRTFAPRVTGLLNLNVNAIAFEPGSATVMYVGTDAGVYKSIDAGNTWAATGQVTGEITDLLTDNEGAARRIWATVRGQGVAYSANAGTSFNVYGSGLATLELTSLDVEASGTSRRIWATTRGGDGVYFSDDLGQTWRPAAGTGLLNRSVNDLTVQKGSARRIWAATDNGVFFSDDRGFVWTGLSLGLPQGVPVTSVSMEPSTGEVLVSLFSPTRGGIYRGGNNGIWTAFSSGLDVLTVKRLTNDGGRSVDPGATATTFYASTAGDGSYSADIRGVASLSPSIVTPGLPQGAVGIPYLKTLVATGGTPPYSWRMVAGSLPPGVTLAATGLLSGTPTKVGPYSLTVQVHDSASRGDRKAFSMTVGGSDGPRPLDFYSVSPCRLIDTRDPAAPRGGPALQAGMARTFTAPGACGIPSTARAISVNLTATSPSAAGDLRLYPAGVAQPLVSSMNYGSGQTRANSGSLPLGTGGAFTVICAQATGTVHFILDVNGYFQ